MKHFLEFKLLSYEDNKNNNDYITINTAHIACVQPLDRGTNIVTWHDNYKVDHDYNAVLRKLGDNVLKY